MSSTSNAWTRACGIVCGACVLMIIAAMTSFAAADTGVRALRIACPEDSNRVEIEPFIAWGDGNSPYKQFGPEEATSPGILHDHDDWFYSLGIDNQESIYTECRTKTRLLRIFVTNQREITVTERGRAVIDALPVGDTWDNWDAIYVLRSVEPNVWNECYGRKSAARERMRCARFDPARPNSKFLSEAAAQTTDVGQKPDLQRAPAH